MSSINKNIIIIKKVKARFKYKNTTARYLLKSAVICFSDKTDKKK